MRKERRTLPHLQEIKAHADRMWDRVYRDILAGKIELGYIVAAMDQCNLADKALMAHEGINARDH